jgi:guanylate kinase
LLDNFFSKSDREGGEREREREREEQNRISKNSQERLKDSRPRYKIQQRHDKVVSNYTSYSAYSCSEFQIFCVAGCIIFLRPFRVILA